MVGETSAAATDGSSRIDLAAVDAYLRRTLPMLGQCFEMRQLAGGQSNPTYRLITDTGHYVLRTKPPGRLLPSAHAVEREFRVLGALRDSSIPVPRVLHLCEDTAVIGVTFYVMEYVSGSVHFDATLPNLKPTTRRDAYRSMAQVLVALGKFDASAALADYGRPGVYFERQIRRWTKQYRASETERRPSMESLIEWLPVNIPQDNGKIALVHGDFRLDNLIFDDHGNVLAVLDWELSTLGHPYADLAYQCAQWRLPAGELRGLKGVDRLGLGIPTEEEYVESYCRGMGINGILNWSFYLAVSLFRLAAISQGVYRRGVEGNASSTEALSFGAKVDVIAAHAAQIISSTAQ